MCNIEKPTAEEQKQQLLSFPGTVKSLPLNYAAW